MITNAEKDVTKNFPVALEHANAYDVLESLYWYQKCKQKSKEDFNNSIRDECRVVEYVFTVVPSQHPHIFKQGLINRGS